jgi:hypothetical protein
MMRVERVAKIAVVMRDRRARADRGAGSGGSGETPGAGMQADRAAPKLSGQHESQ